MVARQGSSGKVICRILFVNEPCEQKVFHISSSIEDRQNIHASFFNSIYDPPRRNDELAVRGNVVKSQFRNDSAAGREAFKRRCLFLDPSINIDGRIYALGSDIINNRLQITIGRFSPAYLVTLSGHCHVFSFLSILANTSSWDNIFLFRMSLSPSDRSFNMPNASLMP